jgi:hypothetical protein
MGLTVNYEQKYALHNNIALKEVKYSTPDSKIVKDHVSKNKDTCINIQVLK